MRPYRALLVAALAPLACSGSTEAPTGGVNDSSAEVATEEDSSEPAADTSTSPDTATPMDTSVAFDSAMPDTAVPIDAGGPGTARARARRDALAKYYGSTCQGGMGLIYRGAGSSAGTQIGAFFRRYTAAPTCTFVVGGDCVSMKCSYVSSTSFDRGGINFKSELGERYVTFSSGSYYTGISSIALIPAPTKPVTFSLRPSGPSPLTWTIPAPGSVNALTAPPTGTTNVSRNNDLVVSWTTTESPAVGSVLVSLAASDTRIECPVDASAGSITIPSAVMKTLPATNGGVTVYARNDAFATDAECEIYQWLERIPNPSTSGRSVFFVDP